MKHTISKQDFEEFIKTTIRQKIAGAYGEGENKTLVFAFDVGANVPSWEVFASLELVSRHYSLLDAVESYNAIEPLSPKPPLACANREQPD